MSVSITPCPSCNCMLLGDSPQCPHCGHVLDPARAAQFMALIPADELGASDDEQPCTQCGEMVRYGLVRCWACGAFMDPELEASYRAMQASPSPVIYSQVDATRHKGASSAANPAQAGSQEDEMLAEMVPAEPAAPAMTPIRSDDDFELSPTALMDDDDFQLAPSEEASYDADAAAGYQAYQTDAAAGYQAAEGYQEGYQMAEESQHPEAYEAAPAQGYEEYQTPAEEYATEVPPEGYDPSAAEAPSAPTPVGEYPVYTPEAEQAAEAAPADADAPPADESAAPHSVATGGDVLLAAALQEEKDAAVRAKRGPRGRRGAGAVNPADGFVVFCPNGHRVQVKDRHRGRAGRCPQCKALFIVPLPAPTPEPAPGAEGAPAESAPAANPNAIGKYGDWILDLHVHAVNPTKLKLKAGSLVSEYETVDVGFAATELLVATVFKGGGPFRGMQEPKKKAAAREALREHLMAEGAPDKLPLPRQVVITAEEASQLKVVQPANPLEESLFADVPVFGVGRIAVRLPGAPVNGERLYLSFSLTEFREFARLLAQTFGIENFGQELGIPLSDEITELKCHYSDTLLQSLGNLDFYRADPKFKVVLIGRKCQGCGLVVSEDSRKKEKIGGASGSAIAKAICPKCKKKFGDTSLFGLGEAPKPAIDTAPAAAPAK